jgi:hypothetical protein
MTEPERWDIPFERYRPEPDMVYTVNKGDDC